MSNRIEIDSGTGELLAEIRNRVAILTLNRPEARNALSDRLTPAITEGVITGNDSPDFLTCVRSLSSPQALISPRAVPMNGVPKTATLSSTIYTEAGALPC